LQFTPRESRNNGALTGMRFKLKIYKEIAEGPNDAIESSWAEIG